MNALPARPALPESMSPTVDPGNPWLGLASYTEETREYFCGREDEVAELARRVQRKLLTILFGQSGLGKTSILRAGLVPRLRDQGYCPVYVRIDYGRDAPEPAVQIKQAIADSARDAGAWTQAGTAVEGESLWEYLHHRDDTLRDESGTRLIPLLIFDQFEEIFTLAQTDDFGRARAARFIVDLADLVENRPPAELEAALDADEAAAERFDFARSDYRVLLALREDYLAPLESLKTSMPSITQNRLRLAPMTGRQAQTAVTHPGGKLVSEEVAGAIVRFVAGGAEIANAEVEPSLLSLICRELNDVRIAQGRSEISLDLLAGTHDTILSEFYERCLADQRPAVRHVIEDDLLTVSGFRENVAEERVLERLAAAGAPAGTLQVLVNRRLLRVEERLDLRRVELTHDVLCGVVKASRDMRRERDVREATERQLQQQRDRELAARRALFRARRIAVICILLTIAATAAAGYGYVSARRARLAEQRAQTTRMAAEHARGEAERLLGYLTNDLSLELEGIGRVKVVADLAKREVDYYRALPAELQSEDTRRNEALALVEYGAAQRSLSQSEQAQSTLTQAIGMLDALRQRGDRSDATAIGLGLGLAAQAAAMHTLGKSGAHVPAERAVEVVEPVATAANASLDARRAYGRILLRAGWLQYRRGELDRGIATLETGRAALAGAGALDLSDLPAAVSHAEISAWLGEALNFAGRQSEAEGIFTDSIALTEKILKMRPGHMGALRAGQLATSNFGDMLLASMRMSDGATELRAAEIYGVQLANLDPANFLTWNNLGESQLILGQAVAQTGQPLAALAPMRLGMQSYARGDQTNFYIAWGTLEFGLFLANLEADLGDHAASATTLARLQAVHASASTRADDSGHEALDCALAVARSSTLLIAGDAAGAAATAQRAFITNGKGVSDDEQRTFTESCRGRLSAVIGDAELTFGGYGSAEAALKEALARGGPAAARTDREKRWAAQVSTLLALTLVHQGKLEESRSVIRPVLAFQRDLYARNRDDRSQHVELAAAIYAAALADGAHRAALLTEASGLLARLPAQMRTQRSVGVWTERIKQSIASHARG